MRRLPILLVLASAGCGKEAAAPVQRQQSNESVSASTSTNRQSKPAGKMAATKAMLEIPADKGELQRLVALGYAVHDDHLHPPGVKECPFNMGGSMVQ